MIYITFKINNIYKITYNSHLNTNKVVFQNTFNVIKSIFMIAMYLHLTIDF